MNPLYDIEEINIRLDTIEAFIDNPDLLNYIRNDLKKVFDIQRI